MTSLHQPGIPSFDGELKTPVNLHAIVVAVEQLMIDVIVE